MHEKGKSWEAHRGRRRRPGSTPEAKELLPLFPLRTPARRRCAAFYVGLVPDLEGGDFRFQGGGAVYRRWRPDDGTAAAPSKGPPPDALTGEGFLLTDPLRALGGRTTSTPRPPCRCVGKRCTSRRISEGIAVSCSTSGGVHARTNLGGSRPTRGRAGPATWDTSGPAFWKHASLRMRTRSRGATRSKTGVEQRRLILMGRCERAIVPGGGSSSSTFTPPAITAEKSSSAVGAGAATKARAGTTGGDIDSGGETSADSARRAKFDARGHVRSNVIAGEYLRGPELQRHRIPDVTLSEPSGKSFKIAETFLISGTLRHGSITITMTNSTREPSKDLRKAPVRNVNVIRSNELAPDENRVTQYQGLARTAKFAGGPELGHRAAFVARSRFR